MRKEILGSVVASLITAFITALVVSIYQRVKTVPTFFVPKGAVMAFSLAGCPGGWKEVEALRGRFIIGTGKSDYGQNFGLGLSGGEMLMKLEQKHLPKHDHGIKRLSNVVPHELPENQTKGKANVLSDSGKDDYGDVGNNEPFSLMPPYFPCLYCEKL
jgi:hypothetical protein